MINLASKAEIGALSYSDYQLILQLKSFYKLHGRRPYRWEYGQNGLPEYDELLERFKTYNRTMRLAGLKATRPKEADLVEAVQHFVAENHRIPTQMDASQGLLLYSEGTFMRRLGCWSRVLLAAGFHPPLRFTQENPPERKYLILRLQKKARQLGRIPTRSDIASDPDMPANYWYTLEFRSLLRACEVARIREVLQLPTDDEADLMKREEMIAYLKRVADYLGYAPSAPEMKLLAKPGFGPWVYCRVFGSWFKALEAAGLKTVRGYARYWEVRARKRTRGAVIYRQVA